MRILLLYRSIAAERALRFNYIEANFSFIEEENSNGEIDYAIPTYYEHFVVDQPGEPPYLRIRLQATWEQRYRRWYDRK